VAQAHVLSAGVRGGQALARVAAGLLFALPLAAAVPLALHEAADAGAWRALASDPQTLPAAWLALSSAVLGTAIAAALALWLTTALHGSPAWQRLSAALAPMLALPHAAFAIGLAWLVAPTGAIARALAALLGWQAPPPWQSVNDPWALGLTAVLVFKELPFILWNMAALLARPEVAADIERQVAVARTMGYDRRSWWWRVGWPQWSPRLAWPLLAVLAYALTVVDLGLIIGPGSPPTLAVLAYADLQAGSPARNARGAAATVLLALLLACTVAAVAVAWRVGAATWRRAATRGRRPAPARHGSAGAGWAAPALQVVYALVGVTLLVLSVAGVWTFPAAWPQSLTLEAWRQVHAAADSVGFTAALAASASLAALVLTVAWLEATPPRWDRRASVLVLAPLVLPPLLLMAGLYQGALYLRLDGSWLGLAWVHTLVVLPYSFITLQPAWRSFDPRYEPVALALGRRRWAFWWRVKWPLLAAPLAASAAVGFAVSVAQFLATQFLGAGRHATVTTEAVTLASGGQRTLAAAFALLQALLPLAGFAAAAWVRRRTMHR